MNMALQLVSIKEQREGNLELKTWKLRFWFEIRNLVELTYDVVFEIIGNMILDVKIS